MQAMITLVISTWSIRLKEFHVKHPDKDISERLTEVEYLEEVDKWLSMIWERLTQEYRLNTHVTLQGLKMMNEIKELKNDNKRLEADLKTLKENIK